MVALKGKEEESKNESPGDLPGRSETDVSSRIRERKRERDDDDDRMYSSSHKDAAHVESVRALYLPLFSPACIRCMR